MRIIYCRYHYRGSFVDEYEVKQVSERAPDWDYIERYKGCFAYDFYEVEVSTSGDVEVTSKPLNWSGLYFIDGTVCDEEHVRIVHPNEDVLLDNMQTNGWTHVVRTRVGGWRPWGDAHHIVSSKRRAEVAV